MQEIKEISAIIAQQMRQAVENYICGDEQNSNALSFLEYKSQWPMHFGELAVLHYQMFGGQSNSIFQAAASVELMMLALDIIDDLQDQDQPTIPWNQLDQALSLNIAIGFLSLSVSLLAQASFEPTRKTQAVRYLSAQVLKAVNGQYADLLNRVYSEADYLEIVKQKSGSLVACACLVGTALASESHLDSVAQYGEMIGVAAQIKNDIEDICRWDEKNDLIHKKKTLPALYLLQHSGLETQVVRDYYQGKVIKETMFENKSKIMRFIENSGALEYSEVMMRVYQLQALELIKRLNVDQEWIVKLQKYIS